MQSRPAQYQLSFGCDKIMDFTIVLSNKAGEQQPSIGYRKQDNAYFSDRSHSGDVTFSPDFLKPLTAPRLTNSAQSNIKIIADAVSVELFADVMANQYDSCVFSKNKI